MAEGAAVAGLAELGRLLLARPELDRDQGWRALQVDEYLTTLRRALSAILAEHQFSQTPVSGLAVVTAAMLIREEAMALDTVGTSVWEETRRAITLALAAV
jgi:hypothetical protein